MKFLDQSNVVNGLATIIKITPEQGLQPYNEVEYAYDFAGKRYSRRHWVNESFLEKYKVGNILKIEINTNDPESSIIISDYSNSPVQ